MRESYANA